MVEEPPSDEAGDTEKEIMDATYRALREYGYADLSISKIADEFEKSKSVLYYHYDGKDDLLVAFLDYATERFSEDIADATWTDPEAQLRSFLDRLLPTTLDDKQRDIQVAMFELRGQAPHNEVYRERFSRTDQLIRDTIAEYIRAGVEDGSFRDVDPDETARLFLSTINGGMLERVTTNDDSVDDLRLALERYIDYLTTTDVS